MDEETRKRYERIAEREEAVQAQIDRVKLFLNDSLNGYIGQTPKFSQKAWDQIRDKAEQWMNIARDGFNEVTFTDDEGNEVTPEMMADWHFDGKTHNVNIKGVPKYPIDYITVSLSLNEDEVSEETD